MYMIIDKVKISDIIKKEKKSIYCLSMYIKNIHLVLIKIFLFLLYKYFK